MGGGTDSQFGRFIVQDPAEGKPLIVQSPNFVNDFLLWSLNRAGGDLPFVEEGSLDGVPGRLSPDGPVEEKRPLQGAIGPGVEAIQPGPVVGQAPGAHGKYPGLAEDEIEIPPIRIGNDGVALLPIPGAKVIRYIHLGDHDTQAQSANLTKEAAQFRMIARLLQGGEVGLDAQTADRRAPAQLPLEQSEHLPTLPLGRW